MFWTSYDFITNLRRRIGIAFTYLIWALASAIVLALIAGMYSPRFEHWWEGLIALGQL